MKRECVEGLLQMVVARDVRVLWEMWNIFFMDVMLMSLFGNIFYLWTLLWLILLWTLMLGPIFGGQIYCDFTSD